MDAQSPHPAELDARLRARKVERRAELLEAARGRVRWSWTWLPFSLLVAGYLFWLDLETELLVAFLAFLVMNIATEQSLSRRLDALVKLFEEEQETAAP